MDEYIKYSSPKSRVLDRRFIESFDANILSELVDRVGAQHWVPSNLLDQENLQQGLYNKLNGNSDAISCVDGTSDLILPSDQERVHELDAM